MTSPAREDVERTAQAVVDDLGKSALAVNACILGTRLMVELAGRNGWTAVALPTRALAINRLGIAYAGRPISQWPPTAWSVGIEPEVPPLTSNAYSAHLVAIVDGRWLVDTTARQFDRPQRGLHVPHGPVVLPWQPSALLKGRTSTEVRFAEGTRDEARLTYWEAADLVAQDYRQARDWTHNWRKHMGRLVPTA